MVSAVTAITMVVPRAVQVIPRILSCDTGLTEEQHSYLAFSTGGKIGLQILPLDGNPRKAATVVGHPNKAGTILVVLVPIQIHILAVLYHFLRNISLCVDFE